MAGQSHSQGSTPEQRFRKLYDTHHLEIYGYLRRRTDAATACDAAAETFLVAWRRLDDVPAGDDAVPWLFGVARKTLANQRRSARRVLQLRSKLRATGAGPASTPETVVLRESTIQSVVDAMDQLRQADREVLRLAAWEELSHEEIGQVLGCSTHAVDQRIHRAKQRLRRELDRNRNGQRLVKSVRPPEERGTW